MDNLDAELGKERVHGKMIGEFPTHQRASKN